MSPLFDLRPIVYRSPARSECDERALVLQAADIECEVVRQSAEFAIAVRAADANQAKSEIESYERERSEASSELPHPRLLADGWIGILVYALVLLFVDILRDRHVFGMDWFNEGKTVAGLIREGQWWRTVTALTLHMDAVHLMANMFFGGLFGLFAGQMLGSGFAWLGILIGGAMGNGFNAWIQPEDRSSIGASTAVFAALGMVCMLAWGERRAAHRRWFRRWSPVIAGVVLFAYTGVGGERTDVSAHVTGFLSGLMLGGVCGVVRRRIELGFRSQAVLGLISLAGLSLCWLLALRAAT